MNKKGMGFEVWYNILIFCAICIILFLIYKGIDISAKQKLERESCTKIGMEYHYIDGTEFCIDHNNQAHYVKIECDGLGFGKYNCNPRLISIGELRIKPGGD